MSATTLQLTPGEVILGNRIRSCFPARVADAMLPKAVDDLIDLVRHALQSHTITMREARTWVVMQLHKLNGHKESVELDGNEGELMRRRITYLFPGKVL